MKKRILAIMLVLPLLIAFAAMGFTKLISMTIPQLPEDIRLDYDQIEAFEFEDFGQTMELKGEVIPQSSGEQLVWSSSNEKVAAISGNVLTFLDEGTAVISASLADGKLKKSFEVTLLLSGDTPKFIKSNFNTPTEKGDTVIGLKDFAQPEKDGGTKGHTELIDFKVLPSKSPQDITVEGLPQNSYTVDGGQISFTPPAAGEYTLKIKSQSCPDVVREMSFEVKDCVNVYSYADLMRATNKSSGENEIALRVNLESGSNLGRTNSSHMGCEAGQTHEYYQFESTYDTDFLKNSNLGTMLKAAVVFKSNVYGNGHTINLHDLVYPSEVDPSTGIAIPGINDVFASDPLQFVAAAGLTVYGQGNAGFLVQKDNIVLDNLVLKNCNNVNDLSNLNYVGTVLEVAGNDITLKNSTVQNGRTVVRSFSNRGLTIDNCILAYAREFIYKQGSNRFVHPDQSGQPEGEPKKWEEAKKDLFDSSRLPAEALEGDSTATIKDTSFYTSGLFCIGMDAHFAGEFLYQWPGSNKNIKNLAATSFKSKLNLQGDVRFYDWKEAGNMDGSTLISGSYRGVEFKLDLYQLIKNYDSAYGNRSIIKRDNGKEYVHGGIAFFGGGNNLSEVYFNGEPVKGSFGGEEFISFKVLLSDPSVTGGDIMMSGLSMAAGEGPFYFCIYRNSYNGVGINDSPFGL